MAEHKRKANWTVAAIAVTLMLVATGTYVGGYFAMAETEAGPQVILRVYESKWVATMYGPVAKVESTLTGRSVYVAHFWLSNGEHAVEIHRGR